jgi:putative cell wall-binding protein
VTLKPRRSIVVRALISLVLVALVAPAQPARGVVASIASFSFSPPVPIAPRGTLSSGSTVTVTVTALDGSGNPLPGVTIWGQFFATSAPTTSGAATLCGASLSTAKSCVTDGNGQATIVYTAGDATLGADLLQIQDSLTTPTIAPANDTYCYNAGSLTIVPAPIASPGVELAGAVRGGTLTDLDKNGHPIPGATVWLSLAQVQPEGSDFKNLPPNGSAFARSSGSTTWTSLGLTSQPFVTDSAGQVPFYYRTPSVQPTDQRDDALLASDKGSNGCLWSAHYRFLAQTSGTRTDRIAGPDRYNTAADISNTYEAYGTANTVFVATGLNFPDALAGAAAAGHMGAPILLVNQSIPAIAVTQLQRLKPQHIIILGGTQVVSSAVESQLHAYAPDVRRWGGQDRYGTAQLIAQNTYPSGASTVFIATGSNFPDALAGAAAAGHVGAPILLVGPGSTLPASTVAALQALKPTHIVILGGTSVVSSAQANALKAWDPAPLRFGGADRYGTAQQVADHYFPGAPIAFVATGQNFPDALAGAAVAGYLDAPVELVTLNAIPSSTLSSIGTVVKPRSMVVLGGTAVISTAVQTQLATLP